MSNPGDINILGKKLTVKAVLASKCRKDTKGVEQNEWTRWIIPGTCMLIFWEGT